MRENLKRMEGKRKMFDDVKDWLENIEMLIEWEEGDNFSKVFYIVIYFFVEKQEQEETFARKAKNCLKDFPHWKLFLSIEIALTWFER